MEMMVVVVGGGVGRRKAWPTCGRRRRRLQMMTRKRREEEEEREERRLGIFTKRKERGLYYARVGKGREEREAVRQYGKGGLGTGIYLGQGKAFVITNR